MESGQGLARVLVALGDTLIDVTPIVIVLVGFQAFVLRKRLPHMRRTMIGIVYLKTLFPPQPFYFLVIDLPAFNAKQRGNLPVAIAAILLCQPDQSQPKAVIISWGCFIALCGPGHADRSASPPLG